MICGRNCSEMNPGDACPECGHWSGFHPSVINPAVEQCPLCVVDERLRDLEIPDSWRLAASLLEVAKSQGWHEVQRGTSPHEVEVIYRRA